MDQGQPIKFSKKEKRKNKHQNQMDKTVLSIVKAQIPLKCCFIKIQMEQLDLWYESNDKSAIIFLTETKKSKKQN